MKSILLALTLLLAACGGSVEAVDRSPRDAVVGDVADWRVLADEHGVGGDPAAYLAMSNADYRVLWSELGFDAERPNVDLDDEIVFAFTVLYPTGCEFPFLELEVDHAAGSISPRYGGNEPAVCADDENPYTVAVAVGRDVLTAEVYHVRLTTVPGEVVESTAVELRRPDNA